MKNRQRISRRVLRHFLQLAAATFAIGANVAPASAGNDEASRAADQQEENKYTHGVAAEGHSDAYPLSFALPAPSLAPIAGQARADVRVLDGDGRKLVQLALDGASMIGPFDHGAYTVLIKANGMTEVHRLRIGTDTLPYLYFTENV
ncbi:hypothetical protein [Parazoarcus communis]|uniref:hypothetical protein n=1 Tax=Parazoarcus communis TaxID=41977 RepID=UPI00131F2E3B|nr:hypothetical protein [Parazoarcus communis]